MPHPPSPPWCIICRSEPQGQAWPMPLPTALPCSFCPCPAHRQAQPRGPGCPCPSLHPLRIGRAQGTGERVGELAATPHTGCAPTVSWRPNGCLVSRKVLGQGQLEMSQGSHLPWGEPSEAPTLGLWAAPISAVQRVPRAQAHLARLPAPLPLPPSHTQVPGPSPEST